MFPSNTTTGPKTKTAWKMPDWAKVVIGCVAVFLLHFLLDLYCERKNRLQDKINEYTGIKDEENTDDFLPW